MNNRALSFSDFVNENYQESIILSDLIDGLNDFTFEKKILFLVRVIEEKWSYLMTKYNWNRSESNFIKPHFTINIKIYNWPDNNRTREILKIEELTDEDLANVWNAWLYDTRENFSEELNTEEDWVKSFSFSGRSGGWLYIEPYLKYDDQADDIQTLVKEYKQNKENIDISEEVKEYVNSGDYQYLVDIGAIHDVQEIIDLKTEARELEETLQQKFQELTDLKSNIDALYLRIEKFKKGCVLQFYQYVKAEPEYALDGAMNLSSK